MAISNDKLAETLGRIEEKIDNLEKNMDRRIERELKIADGIHEAHDAAIGGLREDIEGNGKAGLKVRMSKIEQAQGGILWALRAIGAALIPIMYAAIRSLWTP